MACEDRFTAHFQKVNIKRTVLKAMAIVRRQARNEFPAYMGNQTIRRFAPPPLQVTVRREEINNGLRTPAFAGKLAA